MSIKFKLLILHILISMVLLTILSIAAYFLLSSGLRGKTIHPWDMRYAEIQETAEGQNIITGFSQPENSLPGDTEESTVMSRYSRDDLLKLLTPEGIITIGDLLIEEEALDDLYMSEDYSVWFYADTQDNTTNVVAVTRSSDDIDAILVTFRHVLFIIGPLALILASLVGFLYLKRSFHPIQVMASTLREIEENNLGKRLEVHSKDELGYLASTYNRMLNRLENTFQREKQFTGDASHELRAPLAVIQGEATLALSKDRNIEDYRQSLGNIYQQTENMSSVLKRLLFLARYEDSRLLDFSEINLGELLNEMRSDLEILCDDKSIRCELYTIDNMIVKGHRVSLQEMYFNIIDNAIRYTPEGGVISAVMERKDKYACIAVKDTGIGIPEEHIKHIFERFYRVDKSQSRSEGGAGLGLAISQRIAEIHNGYITVESEVDKGSIFYIYLPLIK